MINFTPEEKSSLLDLFFQVAEEQTAIMARAGCGREWKDAAHALKGAAANLGLTSFAQKCAQAENGDETPALLEGIRAELHYMREHRNKI